ncbi:hypothetical protein SANTM175S_05273 [Streptomyces antimycoticus]
MCFARTEGAFPDAGAVICISRVRILTHPLTAAVTEPLPETSVGQLLSRDVRRAPAPRSFSAAGLLGRMTLSMTGIGVVTMISELTGRYGLAGALSATHRARRRRGSDRRSPGWWTGTGSAGCCARRPCVALTAGGGLLPSRALRAGRTGRCSSSPAAASAACRASAPWCRARWAAMYRGRRARAARRVRLGVHRRRGLLHLRADHLDRPVHHLVPGGALAARRLLPGDRRLLADRAAGHRARTASAWATHRPFGAALARAARCWWSPSWRPARSSGRSTW